MKYHRQELLLGREGQEQLGKSTVVIVGVGAIGSVAAELLVRAGVNLMLIDRDIVESHNLQRQLLYTENDVGRPKAIVAADRLQSINSSITVTGNAADLDYKNVELLKADIVLDGTDNFDTRFLIDEYCDRNKIPWIYAAAVKDIGTVYVVAGNQPRFSSIFAGHHGSVTCDTAGVLNSVTTAVASIQVTQALKILLGKDFEKSMMRLNQWDSELTKISVPNRTPLASYPYLEGRQGTRVVKLCGSGTYQVKGDSVSLDDIRRSEDARDFGSCVNLCGVTVFADGRAIVKAGSPEQAKARYAQVVG